MQHKVSCCLYKAEAIEISYNLTNQIFTNQVTFSSSDVISSVRLLQHHEVCFSSQHIFSWKKKVKAGVCPGIAKDEHGKLLVPTSSKHVPGAIDCQQAFLEIEYTTTKITPSSPPSENCVLFPGGGFNCKNWRSSTLLRDLDSATKLQQLKNQNEPLDPKLLGSRSSLSIWTGTLQQSTEMDLLSFWLLLPCVSKYSVAIDLFLKDHPMGCDECLLLHSINVLRTCGTKIPLTNFRMVLLGEAMRYFKDAMFGNKAKTVLDQVFAGFKSKMVTIEAESERARVAVSLSLLLSTLRSVDVEWQQATEQNEAFFASLDSILSNIQKSSKQTVILTPEIARVTEKSIEYVKAVKSLDTNTVINILNQLIN